MRRGRRGGIVGRKGPSSGGEHEGWGAVDGGELPPEEFDAVWVAGEHTSVDPLRLLDRAVDADDGAREGLKGDLDGEEGFDQCISDHGIGADIQKRG